MSPTRTMKFTFVDGVWLGVHLPQSPSAREWELHCIEIERVRNETRGVLIYSLGGGPGSQQRKQMRDAFHDLTPPPTAVLTGSTLARGVVTALNWYYGDDRIAAFAPEDLAGAFGYLERRGVPLRRGEITGVLEALAKELSITPPWGSASQP